ncbi:MAG TPA: T9SS type A sorting domain-containing protein [Bacteroidia bacterium]|jgi:hypothetical protein|nr:T9SS type A sorting domain-containing protein [Bacteroidia bacterium]
MIKPVPYLVAIAAWLCLSCGICLSQTLVPNLVTSSGDYFATPAFSLSWSSGELSTETTFCAGNPLTQGFQQPILLALSTKTLPPPPLMSVYPNPCIGLVHLQTDSPTPVLAELCDLSGKLLSRTYLSGTDKTIDVSGLSNALYILTIRSSVDQSLIHIFKINKTQ